MKRIGIFAGTFDPVHDGHLAFADQVVRRRFVEHVAFIPEPSPRFKRPTASLPHRAAMLDCVTQRLDWASVYKVKHDSFTMAATLPFLEHYFLGHQLVLLMGSDVVRHMVDWEDPDDRLKRIPIIVGVRDGYNVSKEISRAYNITIIQTYASFVSSTAIRSGDLPHTHPVAEYIQQHRLY